MIEVVSGCDGMGSGVENSKLRRSLDNPAGNRLAAILNFRNTSANWSRSKAKAILTANQAHHRE
jgi:hypothetical protein